MLTFALDPYDRRVHVDDTVSNMDYFCPVCGTPLIPRRGNVRRHHFAHKGERLCTDTWSRDYDESDWHLAWQERFPKNNREVTLELGDVRHRADILTGRTVIEFQKSALGPEQFNDRNTFYQDLGYKVVWLYDLREQFRDDLISQVGDMRPSFTWKDPRKPFRAYDLKRGNVDLFFQLRDKGDDPCIVRPENVSPDGFEYFDAQRWMDEDDFLSYVGLRNGVCVPPEMAPLEPNESYLDFKEHYGIRLDRQQERAAQTVDGATLLLAVPGSGKTTTLVARLGYLTLVRGIAPESVICITYTKAAAEEMRSRFAARFRSPDVAGKVTFCTINKLAKDIYEDSCRRLGVAPRHVDQNATKAVLLGTYKKVRNTYVSEDNLVEVETAISYMKNMMLADDADTIADISSGIEGFAELLDLYRDGLRSRGLMDFDDQILLAFEALKRDRKLWRSWRERFRYWCIDEAQDTSRIQHNLIYRLAGRDGNVFMVGDEDQSIFGYRGAYPKAMLNFKYVYTNVFTIKMKRNYRSGEEIVAAASRFIKRNKGRFDKGMAANRGNGAVVRVLPTKSRSGQWQTVHELVRDVSGKTAVLYRDNDTAIPFVDRLLREGTPFRLRKGKRTFFDSPVIRDIKAFVALSRDPWDGNSFMRVYYKAGCFLKKRDAEWAVRRSRRDGPSILNTLVEQMSAYRKKWEVERDTENAERFGSLIRGLSDSAPASSLASFANGGYGEYLKESGLSIKLDILKDLASRETDFEGLFSRLDALDKFFRNPTAPKGDCKLTLSSVHSAKGLEFDTVIIMDAVDGTFPSTRPNVLDRSKDSSATYQEERRLFYVAITRARNELVLVRPEGERTPFVDEVIPRDVSPAKQSAPSPRQRASRVDEGEAERNDAHPIRMPHALTQVRPSSPRYDVNSWEVKGRISPGRRVVTNGDMDALITDAWVGRTIEMVADLESDVLAEVGKHVGELSYGTSKFVLCLSATAQQAAGNVSVALWSNEGITVKTNAYLAPCIAVMEKLVECGVALTMTIRDAAGKVIGRSVERIDTQDLMIRLSGSDLGVY